jgi:hypothetical protein
VVPSHGRNRGPEEWLASNERAADEDVFGRKALRNTWMRDLKPL